MGANIGTTVTAWIVAFLGFLRKYVGLRITNYVGCDYHVVLEQRVDEIVGRNAGWFRDSFHWFGIVEKQEFLI